MDYEYDAEKINKIRWAFLEGEYSVLINKDNNVSFLLGSNLTGGKYLINMGDLPFELDLDFVHKIGAALLDAFNKGVGSFFDAGAIKPVFSHDVDKAGDKGFVFYDEPSND